MPDRRSTANSQPEPMGFCTGAPTLPVMESQPEGAPTIVAEQRPAPSSSPSSSQAPRRAAPPVVEIVVPVHDEARVLRASIERLHTFLAGDFPFTWRITIVDNASTDGTHQLADELPRELDGVRAITSNGRVGASRCAPRGWPATRRWSRTWTSTSRPGSTRCCRSWRRWCRGTPTSRSGAAWRRARTWLVDRSARRSHVSTT